MLEMTETLPYTTTMRGRTIIVLLVSGLATTGAGYLCVARESRPRCDEIVESPVRSPDGKSIATSAMKACPVGFLSTTDYSVSVTLSSESAASSSKTEDSVFEFADTAEEPSLTSGNEHELIVRVNDFGEVQVSKHEAGDVKISYTVPKWIWDRLGMIEANRLRN